MDTHNARNLLRAGGSMRLAAVLALSITLAAPLPAQTIHQAARDGDTDTVESLIAAGQDPVELDDVVGGAIHWAAARGHAEVVQALLSAGVPVDSQALPPDHLTPLHFAAISGHLEVMEVLLAAGADLTAGEGAVGTALHHAAGADRGDAVRLLLVAGADPRALSNSPYATYPIHFAAQSRGTHALEALVESGVDVDIAGEDGTTALHLATFHAYWPAVYFLIEAGADPYAVSSRYETPVALSRYHPDIMTLLGTLNLEQEGQ